MSSGDTEEILLVTGMFMVLLFSLLGNTLTIAATCKFANLRTRTHFLIANLAVSDILVSLLAAPLRIAQSFDSLWSSRVDNCKVVIVLTLFFCNASVLNLTLISIDRAISIASPLTYNHSSKSLKLTLQIATSWMIAVIISVLPFIGFGWQSSSRHTSEDTTVDICRYSSILNVNYIIFVFATAVFLPLFIMICCYAYILRIALVHLRRIYAIEKSVQQNSREIYTITSVSNATGSRLEPITDRPRPHNYRSYLFMKELKAAKMVAMVIGFFVLCVVPIVVIDIAEIACGYPCAPQSLVTVAVCLSYMNPAVNIFAYATISSDYRKAYKRLFCCKCKSR